MDILRLRYFKTVAHIEHLTKAAVLLRVSQPALSKTISLLEEDIGVSLFDKDGRNIKLNEQGRIFLKYVEEALNAIEYGVAKVNEVNHPEKAEIKMICNLVGDGLLIKLLHEFKALNPGAHFHILQHFFRSKFRPDFDFFITSSSVNLYNCNSIPLFREEIFLGVSPNNPLSERKHILLQHAADHPFISLVKDSNWQQEARKFCHKAGFKQNVYFECDNSETIMRLIKMGDGVGFIPEKSWGDIPTGIVLLKIDYPIMQRNINLSWRTDRPLNYLAERFKDFIINYFRN